MRLQHLSLGDRVFDLEATLDCGQVFHWVRAGDGYVGSIGDRAVYLRQSGDRSVVSYSGICESTLCNYLGLNDSLDDIRASFPDGDPHLEEAVGAYPGLRLCRQPEWECLATFITSALKQVVHIRQISLRLRERYGQPRNVGDHVVYTYPTPERLAEVGEAGLRDCGLGFRAKWLAGASERVASGDYSLDLSDMNDDDARNHLCELHGVGAKIANCVLLFGYGRWAAFPIDVWVERVLMRLYAPKSKRRKWARRDMERFVERHFGSHAGYAQQYLFHYARHHDKMLFRAD